MLSAFLTDAPPNLNTFMIPRFRDTKVRDGRRLTQSKDQQFLSH
jgi:hypothetical protein